MDAKKSGMDMMLQSLMKAAGIDFKEVEKNIGDFANGIKNALNDLQTRLNAIDARQAEMDARLARLEAHLLGEDASPIPQLPMRKVS